MAWNTFAFAEAIIATVEPPLTVTSPQRRSRPLFLVDCPHIDSCFNLSSMAASLKWPLFFCPQGGLCGEVQLYFSSTWSLQHVRCLLLSGYLINWCLAQGIQIVECAMTLESGKIIRKRRGWRKRGGLELHGFVLTPYPIPLVFFLLTSPCKDSPQCERLEYARFIWGADQQKAATNICTIIKWKESKERA